MGPKNKLSRVEKAIKIIQEEGIIIFLEKFFRYLKEKLKFLLLPYILLKIKRNNPKSLEELVDFAFAL